MALPGLRTPSAIPTIMPEVSLGPGAHPLGLRGKSPAINPGKLGWGY